MFEKCPILTVEIEQEGHWDYNKEMEVTLSPVPSCRQVQQCGTGTEGISPGQKKRRKIRRERDKERKDRENNSIRENYTYICMSV